LNQLSKKLWAAAALLAALQLPLACQGASAKNSGEEAPRCVSALGADFRLDFEEIPLDDEPEELTDLKPVPGQPNQLLLLDKQGRLRLYELGESGGVLLDKLQLDTVFGEDDCGAVSLAFDPHYAENHFVYVGHCLNATASRITRLTLEEPFADALATAVTIIERGDPRATRPWHNVGSIGFESEAVMWALFGEKTLSDAAQDTSAGLGKLLRIMPSREPDAGGFEPAPDNAEAADASVYALGLRSPWKGARDTAGRYWVADVGADGVEELNLITTAGQNLGWPLAEGTCQAGCRGLIDPLLSYDRASDSPYVLDDPETVATTARSIWVAGPLVVADDASDPYACNLRELMLFGDFFTGWVRGAAADASGAVSVDQQLGHLRFASAFAQDERGVLYATSLGVYKNHGMDPRGRLYRAVATRARPEP
jgi:glucose/arabinose dehydrogenase